GMPLKHTIRWRILSAGFNIVANKYVTLPIRAFERIYPRSEHPTIAEEVWKQNVVFNTTGICEIGILQAEDATKRFLGLAGRHSNPAACELGTIRREYGVCRAHSISAYPIHLKVVHRSEGEMQALRDRRVIRDLLGA